MTVILVIEDEQPIRENLLRILKHQGFQAIGAADGQKGVIMAQRAQPDLILCDITMPELDGYQVLRTLRQDANTAGIPFIFLTARTERADMRQGMNLGADDYLTKPFTSNELIDAVMTRLDKQAILTQPYRDEMKRAADNLSRVAYADPVTNLPNRILFRHQLQAAMLAAQPGQTRLAVLCLNVDRFRTVNATWGNAVGDALLQAIAQRLQQTGFLTARLYSDEFSLLFPLLIAVPTESAGGGDGEDEALTAAIQPLLALVTQPYSLNGQTVSITVSIGAALGPDHGTQADQLMLQADTARRWCRQQGGNSYALYQPELEAVDVERRSLEADLNLALGRSQFQLHYQPQVNIATGRIIGVEALLRWHHPTRGAVPPTIFIPIAEDSGVILPLGEWVLRTACQEMQTLQALTDIPLHISVNLSARQFRHPNLVEMIGTVLQETGFNPTQLAIELTETSVMENVDAAIQTLESLKSLGMDISIDDFGTGYSSLNYLRRLPLDVLKIDRSFVNQVTESDRDAAIASAIISMAKSLNLKVIAEGVETAGQLAFLQAQGCHLIQGYLFSRPLPLAAMQALLQSDHRLQA